MKTKKRTCCSGMAEQLFNEYEFIKLEKTTSKCSLCEDFAQEQIEKEIPIAIMSCEGACLRGEISRRVANDLCFNQLPDKTSRICLGGAFTKDTGQRNLVRSSNRVIALEGCPIKCASRMMKGVIPELKPEVILVDQHYTFDTSLFGINEASENELMEYTKEASNQIKNLINI